MYKEKKETFLFGKEDIPRLIEQYRKNPDGEIVLYEVIPGDWSVLTLSKQNNCARVGTMSVKLCYEWICGNKPWLFTDPNSLIENKNLFLLYLAREIHGIPALAQLFETIYKENPLRYYKNAVSNIHYKHPILNENSLMRDFSTKRIYGILLTAEDDIELRNCVESLFYTYDSELEDLIIRESAKLADRGSHHLYNTNGAAAWHIFAYLLLNRYDGVASPFINYFVRNVVELNKENELRKREDSAVQYIKGDRDPFRFLECSSQYSWKIIRNTKSIDDIQSIALANEKDTFVKEWADKSLNLSLKRLVESCPSEDPCYNELRKVKYLLEYLAIDAEMNGLSIYQMLHGRKISKAEQQEILREYAWYHTVTCKNEEKITKTKLTIDLYISLLLHHFLFQNEKDEKKFFFENNNETMFSQVSVLNEQIEKQQHEREQLTAQIAELNDDILSLQRENELLKAALKKGNKAAEAPCREEIARLHKQNASLENKLNEEKEKTTELNLLREFAFDVQSQYSTCGTETAFADRIRGKRIVVVGGHINWRNKLKKKYPEVTVWDGHVETQDISLFDKADFVFLNVSNMNHGVYYKAIGALRDRRVPYDYLGRTTNQELYEREMADILAKHGIN